MNQNAQHHRDRVHAVLIQFLKTDQVRDYVRTKIRLLLASSEKSLRYPMDWSLEFLSDCNHAAFVIARAIQHPRRQILISNFASLHIIELVRCACDVHRYAENIPITSSVLKENFLHQFT